MKAWSLVSILLFTLGCSEIEHALDNADKITKSTEELKLETKRGLRKQKEAGAILSMDKALEKIETTIDARQRQLRAKLFYKSMPFQFIPGDKKKTEQLYSDAMGFFFTEAYPKFSVRRNSITEAVVMSIKEDYNVQEPPIGSLSTLVKFRELAALALQMYTISTDQKTITQKPKSFYDLCEELVRTSFSFGNCQDCKYDQLPQHLRDRLQFADDAIDFLQFAHNVQVYAALGQIFNSVSTKDFLLHKAGYKELTLNGLVKKTTTANDLDLAVKRLERAEDIRQLFNELGIKVHYSKLNHKDKLRHLLNFPQGKDRAASFKNTDKRNLFRKYMKLIKKVQAEYVESKTQGGS